MFTLEETSWGGGQRRSALTSQLPDNSDILKLKITNISLLS